MATCRDIVTLGLRQAAIIGLDETPTDGEATHGLKVLQSYYDNLFKSGPLKPLVRKYADADYTANEREHVTAFDAGVTVTIPDTFTDQETQKTRAPIELATVVVSTGGSETNYVFSTGAWESASGLTLSSTAPLSGRDEMGLAADFALFFSEAFGGQVGPATLQMGRNFKRGLMFNGGHRWLDENGVQHAAAEYY